MPAKALLGNFQNRLHCRSFATALRRWRAAAARFSPSGGRGFFHNGFERHCRPYCLPPRKLSIVIIACFTVKFTRFLPKGSFPVSVKSYAKKAVLFCCWVIRVSGIIKVGNGLDRSVSTFCLDRSASPLQPIIMIAWIGAGIITYLSIRTSSMGFLFGNYIYPLNGTVKTVPYID